MLSQLEEKKIIQWHQKIEKKLTPRAAFPDHPRSGAFKEFCTRFTALAPDVYFQKDSDIEVPRPTLRVQPNVDYQALPLQNELEPFLLALDKKTYDYGKLSPQLQKILEQIKVPADLTVFVSPHCPFCPRVVRQLLGLAAYNSAVHLTVIDAVDFPQTAADALVQSLPTTLLDGEYRWVGEIDAADLIGMMAHRDPANLGPASLKTLFNEGRADEVAAMMLSSGKVFPAYITLLRDDKWSVRLAAMVAFEILAEQDAEYAGKVTERLWEDFDRFDDRVKGDMLYMLGEACLTSSRSKIDAVLEGRYSEDVKEAAAEALAKLI